MIRIGYGGLFRVICDQAVVRGCWRHTVSAALLIDRAAWSWVGGTPTPGAETRSSADERMPSVVSCCSKQEIWIVYAPGDALSAHQPENLLRRLAWTIMRSNPCPSIGFEGALIGSTGRSASGARDDIGGEDIVGVLSALPVTSGRARTPGSACWFSSGTRRRADMPSLPAPTIRPAQRPRPRARRSLWSRSRPAAGTRGRP